ncbi:MAG: sigma-70 family RNA polymerase sigma factor [Alloprevotella sp.]|nr:sigma-70 family RNA polymerase sigma factor [Alloprevotella sp.]
MHKAEELNLIERAERGDEAAMRQIYDRHVRTVTAICRRYVVRDDALRDTLQDVFLAVFQHLPQFRWLGEGSLRAWICRLAVNKSLDTLRQHTRLEAMDALDDVDVADEPMPPMDGVPMEELMGMIQHLPDGQRTVFNLFVFENLTHREIAQRLGIREASSASQYHHARCTLARMVGEYIRIHDL